jgi:hypothetical protein
VIEKAEHQKRCKQRLSLFTAEPKQERCIEHAQSRRCMARKAQESRGDKYGGQATRPDIQSSRQQDVQRDGGSREVEKADDDLRQDQRTGGKPNRPSASSNPPRTQPAP